MTNYFGRQHPGRGRQRARQPGARHRRERPELHAGSDTDPVLDRPASSASRGHQRRQPPLPPLHLERDHLRPGHLLPERRLRPDLKLHLRPRPLLHHRIRKQRQPARADAGEVQVSHGSLLLSSRCSVLSD